MAWAVGEAGALKMAAQRIKMAEAAGQAGELKMAWPAGEAVTSFHRVREDKMAAPKMDISSSQRQGSAVQFSRRSFQATSSLSCATAAVVDGTIRPSETVQPESGVATHATNGDILHRCAASLHLLSEFLRGELLTSPLHRNLYSSRSSKLKSAG